MKKFLKKIPAVAMSFATICSLVACGGNNGGEEEKGSSITVCLASEPDTLDPALNSAVDGATLNVHLNSGLYRYVQKADGSLGLVYDLAESISKAPASVTDYDAEGAPTVYPEGTRYTVKLKSGLKWSDGSKITADDFIYSWNRAASVKLGADYCYMFESIAGGVWAESDEKAPGLTMSKVDELTFTFDVPVDQPFMDQLLAFPSYFPVQKAVVDKYDTAEDGAWAAEASQYVSSGAYYMAEWVHDSKIVLKKNPNYWNADEITMDEIVFALSDDDAAIYTSFQNGEYQFIDTMPNEYLPALSADPNSGLVVAGQMGTYYVSFNVNKGFAKAETEEERAKVRKALGLLIDRQYIVDEIGQAGQLPANAFVSAGLSDPAGGEFIDHNGPAHDGKGYYNAGATDAEYEANCAEAVALLKEVGYTYDESSKKFTDFDSGIVYLYNTGSGHQAIAENLMDTWSRFGINVQLENQEWATFLNTRKEGQYNIARNGWVADYDDPSSYLDMWTTTSGNNDSQFGRDAHGTYAGYSADVNRDGVKETGLTWGQSYDVLSGLAKKESDPAKRFQLLHEIEDLLMETGAICPIYYYTDPYLCKSNIKGFFSSPLGYKFFMYATVE